MGKTTISAHWFRPLYLEGTNELIGTKIFYVNQADPGGSIPNWIKTTFAPKAVIEAFTSIIIASKKI